MRADRALDKLRQGFVSSCGVSESGCDAYDADEAGEGAPQFGVSGIIRMLTVDWPGLKLIRSAPKTTIPSRTVRVVAKLDDPDRQVGND